MSFDTSLPVFDADQHYYEARDAFTRHVPKEWQERTVYEAVAGNRVRHVVGGKINHSVSNPTFDPIVLPGAMTEYYRGNPEGKELSAYLAQREPIPSYYRDKDARLAKLDEQGIERSWILPTIGMAYEEALQFDVPAAAQAFKAYNRWLLEDWPFNYQDRLYSAPYLAMGDPEACAAEVDWGLAQGARIFVVRAQAVYTEKGWRSPGDAVFDPIWSRLNESRATVIVHVGEVGGHGLDKYVAHDSQVIGNALPPLQIAVAHDRPIADYLGALVCDRLFDRFPDLRVASVENGAAFAPILLAGLRRAGFQRPHYFSDDPVATFKRNIWVAPFWEDDLTEAVETLGSDRVLFGSDYPHPEGLAEPRQFEKVVAELDDPIASRKIMYDNVAELTSLR